MKMQKKFSIWPEKRIHSVKQSGSMLLNFKKVNLWLKEITKVTKQKMSKKLSQSY